jgi:hypothetical protein
MCEYDLQIKNELDLSVLISHQLWVSCFGSSFTSCEEFFPSSTCTPPSPQPIPFRLIEFKEKYEMFCFLGGNKERPLKGEKELLYKHGIEFLTLNDSSTEVFRRIRFKSKRELIEQGQLHQLPNEDSLSFFVRVRCKTTAFNADLTAMKDFQIEYEKFARAEKVTLSYH